MARERTLASFILKRIDYGEADQIITLFTKEEGKVRALVKAAKMPTSKLQPLLQPLFETAVSLSGHKDSNTLAKVIGVQLIKAYSGILEDQAKVSAWYVVSEVLIKALPDGAPNEALFLELENYAQFLHSVKCNSEQIKQSLVQFQIKVLRTLGLGIRTENSDGNVWFSLDRGGFVSEDSLDAVPIKKELRDAFSVLLTQSYENALSLNPEDNTQLFSLINRFVTHQLEREIKSQRLLAGV